MDDFSEMADKREYLLYTELASRLINYRERNNVSQQQFSNITGIPFELIQQLENMDVSIGYYALVYEKLGITMSLDAEQKGLRSREYKL